MPSPTKNALQVMVSHLNKRGNHPKTLAVMRAVSKNFGPLINQRKLKAVQNRKNRATSLIARARYLKTLPVENLTRNNLELLQYVNFMTLVNRRKAYNKNRGFNELELVLPTILASRYDPRHYTTGMFNVANFNGRLPTSINQPRYVTSRPASSGNYYKSTGRRTSVRSPRRYNSMMYPRNTAANIITRILKKRRRSI